MEVKSVNDVLDLCWLEIFSEVSKVILTVFLIILSSELSGLCLLKSSLILFINGLGSCFSKRLAIKVLTLHLRDVSTIARDMLGLNILGWTSDPVFTSLRVIAVLQLFINSVLSRWVHKIVIFLRVWLSTGNLNVLL